MNITIPERLKPYIQHDPIKGHTKVCVFAEETSRTILREFFFKHDESTKFINNSRELEAEINEISLKNKYLVKFKKLKDSILQILEAPRVTFQDFTFSLVFANNSRSASDNAKTSEKCIYYIRQNKIDSNRLVYFMSFFHDLSLNEKPLFFLERAQDSLFEPSELQCKNNRIMTMPADDESIISCTAYSRDFSEEHFLDSFLSNSHTLCSEGYAHYSDTLNMELLDHEKAIQVFACEALKLRSYEYTKNKFLALPELLQLLNVIDKYLNNSADTSIRNKLLCLSAVVNLWVSYVDESYKEGIERSFAIAEHLNHKYLKAHSQRLAHLSSGYSSFTGHVLKESAEFFKSKDHLDSYVYSQNNRLLNTMHYGALEVDGFKRLADFSLYYVPYLDRMSTIVNNSGVACLLSGDYSEAMRYFNIAQGVSGHYIHHVSIELNKITTRFMDGENIDTIELVKFHNKLKRANLPKGFDYHQCYMHWTLLTLSENNKDFKKMTFDYLASKMFMNYPTVLDGKESMVDFLANNSLFFRSFKCFPGVRGNFIHRTGLFPIIHFAWM